MERRKTGTYVSCDFSLNSAKLLSEWCIENSIPDPLEKRHYHTTILYSRSNVPNAQSILDSVTIPIELSIIGFKLFDSEDNPDANALVLEFSAPYLVKIHQQLIAAGGTHDYDDYTPHVTVSYKAPRDFDLTKLKLPKFQIMVRKFKAEPLDLDWKE
jgi:2'-5' RNA ligase